LLTRLLTQPSLNSQQTNSAQQNQQEGGGDNAGSGEGGGGLTDADFDSNWDESIETFDGMELPEELLRGIYSYGFEKPSAIQQRAIKPTMMGRDLIAQAQSGTVRCVIWIVYYVFLERLALDFNPALECRELWLAQRNDESKLTIFRV
jgi:hypothetical protein